ncbi:MAG TPA: sigma-70 family RNA polymerase sigma factor [Stenomitos sp.]
MSPFRNQPNLNPCFPHLSYSSSHNTNQTLENLVLQHLWVAEIRAKHFHRLYKTDVELEDFVQAGYTELCTIAKQYRPHRDCKFSTYAWHRVTRPMKRLIDQEQRLHKATRALKDAYTLEVEGGLYDLLGYRELRRSIKTLSSIQQRILEAFYFKEHEQGLSSLSHALGITPATLRRYRHNAIEQLRVMVS